MNETYLETFNLFILLEKKNHVYIRFFVSFLFIMIKTGCVCIFLMIEDSLLF